MAEVQRYDAGFDSGKVKPHECGAYVLHSDYEALEAQIAMLKKPPTVAEVRALYGPEVSDDWVQEHIGFWVVTMHTRAGQAEAQP